MTLYEPEEEPSGMPIHNWKPVDSKPTAKQKVGKGGKEKVKRTLKRKMQMFIALLAVIGSAGLYGVDRVGKFYDEYTTSLQSPILLQSPVKVEKRAEILPPPPEPVKPVEEVGVKEKIIHTAQAKEVEAPKPVPPVGDIQEMMHAKVVAKWGEDQWPAMLYVMQKESSMTDPFVKNKRSGACGIPQALPCSKLLAVCKTLADVDCQLDWMVNYVAQRYTNPAGAKAFHLKNNWY